MLASPPLELQQLSIALQSVIKRSIAEHRGWIGFDQFMQQALYYPGLGYYSNGLPKFGEEGDFVTAPTIGNLFATCLARQCAQIIENGNAPNIYEFGAGGGRLVTDLLLALEQLNRLPDTYTIIETSAGLVQQQREQVALLPVALREKVKWVETLPDSFAGIIIGNELLDAIPFKRFEVSPDNQLLELGVSLQEDQFIWAAGPALPENPSIDNLPALYPGYVSEVSVQANAWIDTIGRKLTKGVILLIDYGFKRSEFYHHDRNSGTLMCHYRHHSHDDVFFWPGLQDITAHVDFSAVAFAAEAAGLTLCGYCDQANFLLSCGLLKLIENQAGNESDPATYLAQTSQVKKLIMPHEMGELFKVIALGRGDQPALMGFSNRNLQEQLN